MWLKVMMSNYGCEAESSYDHYRMRNELWENSAKLDSLMKVLNQELKVREENWKITWRTLKQRLKAAFLL
jgi:hypothetical protein